MMNLSLVVLCSAIAGTAGIFLYLYFDLLRQVQQLRQENRRQQEILDLLNMGGSRQLMQLNRTRQQTATFLLPLHTPIAPPRRES